MQICRLRLVGFKSFVDATELALEPGLSGIVGPNGCGKSNLVEALRWVMGETSARRLRGGEMDDVIFAGTTARPARNIAEVALTLDNSSRNAPFAFNDRAEIEVVRRIERGGGSTYRINGREVRARDVQLLFSDAASGAHSGAMVSQGRVAALIDAKPAERRLLLEEAAAAAELQRLTNSRSALEHERQRVLAARREAEQRLAQIDADLEREESHLTEAQAALIRLSEEQDRVTRAEAAAGPGREFAEAGLREAGACLAEAEAVLQRQTEAVAAADARRVTLERRRKELEERRARFETSRA